jgi:hypothetical protein
MSPTNRMARLQLRADTPSSPSSTYTSTDQLIQIATGAPPLPPAIDMSPPNNNLMTLGPGTVSDGNPTPQPQRQGLSGATKLGLGLIPVVVILVGLYILFLFWYRKNRSTRNSIGKSISPPIPEKDPPSYDNSVESTRRTSKVLQTSAFSTPVHNDQNREAQVFGQSVVGDEPSKSEGTKIGAETAVAATNTHLVEVDMDSPIDASSPFRLKRGDTVKRTSLGPELARLWPSPPPSIWIKPYAPNQLPLPINRRESSVYQPAPLKTTT